MADVNLLKKISVYHVIYALGKFLLFVVFIVIMQGGI